MGKYERKKSRRLPIHVILGYLLLLTVLLTGVTVSKYVTSTPGGDSARVAAFGDLKLTESKTGPYIVTPGVDIPKDPKISFGMEKESETSAYVFVKVIANGWTFDKEKNVFHIDKNNKEVLSWTVGSDWEYVAGDDFYQAFYCYVSPNETLNNVSFILGDKITVSPDLYRSELNALDLANHSISFEAYAVQANGFGGPQHAWGELAKSLPKNN